MLYFATSKRQKKHVKMGIMERGFLLFFDTHKKVRQVAAFTNSELS